MRLYDADESESDIPGLVLDAPPSVAWYNSNEDESDIRGLVLDALPSPTWPNDNESESDIPSLALGVPVYKTRVSTNRSEKGSASRGGLCSRCRQIDPVIPHSPIIVENVANLGRIDKLPSRDCSFCQFAHQLLMVEPRVHGHTTSNNARVRSSSLGTEQFFSLMVGSSERAIIRIKDLINEGASITPSRIGSDLLSPNLVQKWLSECEVSHLGQCSVSHSTRDAIDTHLINVERLCLVKATTSERYLALSYVVGGQNGLQLVKSNLTDLLKTNALNFASSAATSGVGITRVVQDAIELVKSQGEKWLWVDSLCIVQDDAATKHEQIMNMDTIYNHAFLTIVSVSGENAGHSLPGIRPGSRPEINLSTDIRGYAMLAQPPRLKDILAASPYETRGWTFQERILSSRCLYLTQWGAYYQCQGGISSENLTISAPAWDSKTIQSNSEHHASIESQRRHLRNLKPSKRGVESNDLGHYSSLTADRFSDYALLVSRYTQRRLSFASDILAAFSGILSAMERSHQCQHIYGLPVGNLHLALLWAPIGLGARRKPITTSSGSEVTLPSWSWAGWECLVGYHTLYQNSLGDPLQTCMPEITIAAPVAAEGAKILEFWATTIDISHCIFQFNKDRRSYKSDILILDDPGVIRGCPDGPRRQLVMISCSASSTKYGPHVFWFPIYGRGGYCNAFTLSHDKLFDERCVQRIVNFLVVEWKGDTAERVAVGLMYRSKWDTILSERTLVRLA
jgi:hypothetical protein